MTVPFITVRAGTVRACAMMVILAAFLAGCQATKETSTPSTPAEIPGAGPSAGTVRLVAAGLDLTGWSGRMEKKLIGELASVLRREGIDILAVQGITRYPTLRNRVDFVDELASSLDYRQAFGETINLSGRETGNAVFSGYPIQSSDNRHYEGLGGTGFESAIHTLIDVGVREIAVLSTRTPTEPSATDAARCQQTIESVAGLYNDSPVVVLGNLSSLRPGPGWADISPAPSNPVRIWITGKSLRGSGSRAVQTGFGTLVITDLDVLGRSVR